MLTETAEPLILSWLFVSEFTRPHYALSWQIIWHLPAEHRPYLLFRFILSWSLLGNQPSHISRYILLHFFIVITHLKLLYPAVLFVFLNALPAFGIFSFLVTVKHSRCSFMPQAMGAVTHQYLILYCSCLRWYLAWVFSCLLGCLAPYICLCVHVWRSDRLISHVKQIRQFLSTVENIVSAKLQGLLVFTFLYQYTQRCSGVLDIGQNEVWPCPQWEGTKRYFVMRWGPGQGDLSVIYGLQLPRPCRKVFIIGVPQM